MLQHLAPLLHHQCSLVRVGRNIRSGHFDHFNLGVDTQVVQECSQVLETQKKIRFLPFLFSSSHRNSILSSVSKSMKTIDGTDLSSNDRLFTVAARSGTTWSLLLLTFFIWIELSSSWATVKMRSLQFFHTLCCFSKKGSSINKPPSSAFCYVKANRA